MLAKAPGFTAVAMLTLALGIGANAAIFSIVWGVILRPLPYQDPQRIYQMALDYHGQFNEATFSFSQFQFLKEHSVWSSGLAAFTRVGVNLSNGQEAERITALHVSSGYFSTLGLRPLFGRDFLAEEDRGQGLPVAILSCSLWQRRFGGDTSVLDRAVLLDGKSYTLVGVMPCDFVDPQGADLWATLAPVASTIGAGQNLTVIARLKPGLAPRQARDQVEALNVAFRKDELAGDEQENVLAIYPLQKMFAMEMSTPLWILLGAVFFVLLVACANVANFLLARGAARSHEVAVRLALGASRRHLVQQFLTESCILALLGALGGLALARVCLASLIGLAPIGLPRLNEIRIDGWTFAFALGIALATGVLFGIVPAFQSSDLDANEALKEGMERGIGTRQAQRVRQVLVVSEIAISLILMVGAALLSETLLHLWHVDSGFDPHRLLSAEIWLTGSRYRSTPELTGFYEELINRLKRVSGVEEIAVVSGGQPFEQGGNVPVTIPGVDSRESADYRIITSGYFRTLQVPLLHGRNFGAVDVETSQQVAIVNNEFVRRFLSSRQVIGSSVSAFNQPPRIIVGVVGDTKASLDQPAPPTLFIPATQAAFQVTLLFDSWFPTHILVRTSGDSDRLANIFKQELKSVDRDVPIGKVRSMEQILSMSLAFQRFMMIVPTLFAGLALIMAAVGIYGVMDYAVVERTREMGVRLALGAQSSDVVRLIVGEGLRLASIGTLIGIAGSLSLKQLLSNLLFGVRAVDLLALVAICVFLVGVTLLACYVPARRAARLDPLAALRHQ